MRTQPLPSSRAAALSLLGVTSAAWAPRLPCTAASPPSECPTGASTAQAQPKTFSPDRFSRLKMRSSKQSLREPTVPGVNASILPILSFLSRHLQILSLFPSSHCLNLDLCPLSPEPASSWSPALILGPSNLWALCSPKGSLMFKSDFIIPWDRIPAQILAEGGQLTEVFESEMRWGTLWDGAQAHPPGLSPSSPSQALTQILHTGLPYISVLNEWMKTSWVLFPAFTSLLFQIPPPHSVTASAWSFWALLAV